MLDIKFIRENKEAVKAAIENKKVKPKVDIEELLDLDEAKRKQEVAVQQLRTEQNKVTEQIKQAKPEQRQKSIDQATELKTKLNTEEAKLTDLEERFSELLLAVPNVTSPAMPVGEDEEENVVLRTWGEVPEFDFEVQDHVELGEKLGLLNVKKAGEISGARFYYITAEAAQMQFGLIQLVFATLTNHELMQELGDKVRHPNPGVFIPIVPPVMMRPEVMKKMDRLDPIDDRFQTKLDDLVLVGSAEHTIGPIHMQETFELEQLPVRYIGYSTAFRREAGSYGKDTRGILRGHQFDKLEMETFVPATMGEVEQEFIVAIQEYLVQQLGIPYQVIQICTGDTGKPDYNQYDIECWIPSQGKYRETHTSDYMTDYQARRLDIRYLDEDGDKQFVHMNDATAFAIGRILVAILENYQQADGTIRVPEVLIPYVGKEIIGK